VSKRMSVGVPLLAASLVLALPHLAWSQADAVDPHAQHQAPVGTNPRVSTADYLLPQVSLVRDDGKRVSLSAELDDGRPVVLNFIYTTCPGICPLMSQVFSQFQRRLGAERGKVHMVSISIDPEQDTPARLRDYAKKFRAGTQWQHYTGTVEASVQVQKAFDAYRGDKMGHDPLTLMRAAPGSPWVRMDGFASASDLFDQYRNLAGVGSTKMAVN